MAKMKEQTLVIELGKTIRAAREDRGYTEEQFAERLDISVRHLNAVERGERRPTYELLYHIIRALGISADQIFYPDLPKDSEAEQVKRLYHICDNRGKKLIQAMIDAILDKK